MISITAREHYEIQRRLKALDDCVSGVYYKEEDYDSDCKNTRILYATVNMIDAIDELVDNDLVISEDE